MSLKLMSADLANLADAAPIALIELTDERRIVLVNPAAENLFGLSRRTMVGALMDDLVADCSGLVRLLERARETHGDVSSSDLLIKPVGIAKARHVTARVRVREGAGPVLALSTPLAREREDGVPGVAGFGRILGHEIKNPLAGISGAAQLLMRRTSGDDLQLLELIRDEASRIERLVNRLSAFELFSAPRLEPINIHQVLDRVVAAEKAAFDGQVSYQRIYDPSLPDIAGDADHLHEAFQNILRNGAEAALGMTSERPAVVKVRSAFETGFAMRADGGRGPMRRAIRVDVLDSGPGVDPERLPGVFDAFSSSKSGGRGLGLTIVKEVVSAHQGQIQISNTGEGTCVSVYLPIKKGER